MQLIPALPCSGIQRSLLSFGFSSLQPPKAGQELHRPEEASTSARFINTVPKTAMNGLLDLSQATDTAALHAGNNYH